MLSKKIAGYQLDLQTRLGKGAFGEVYLGQDLHTGRVIAVKQIALSNRNQKEYEKTIQSTSNEISIMKQIQDPNVVRLLDFQKTQNNWYLVMEYCNQGTLDQYVYKKCPQTQYKFLAESEAILITKQIVSGFKALYANRIVHRDLKMQNLLIHDGVVKIADFGFSKVLESDMEEPLLRTYAGSPLYMSIQILKEQKYSSKCDIWSLGIIFYELLYGLTPWQAVSIPDLISKIDKQPVKFLSKPPLCDATKNLIKRMLEKDEQNRLSWDELFNHQYFNDQIEIEEDNKIINEYTKIQQQQDNLRRSNAKKNLYFEGQNVVQNVQHAQQVQNKLEHLLPDIMQTDGIIKQVSSKNAVDEIPKQPQDIDAYYQKQKQELQFKKIIQDIADWVIHRKNKSVFLNNISQLWFDLNDQLTLIEQHQYYSFLFLLTKYQTSILFKMLCRLQSKKLEKNTKYTSEQWQLFCKSKEFTASTSTIKNDFQIIKAFLVELIPRTQKQLQGALDLPINQKILQICNLEIAQKSIFDQIFTQYLQDILVKVKQAAVNAGQKCTRELLILGCHVQNALNMKEIFEYKGAKQIDFFKYYEIIEKQSNQQLAVQLGL